MLVLSRNVHQKIIITTMTGEQITVGVAAINEDGSVRIGVAAPRTTRIDREEIHLKRMETECQQTPTTKSGRSLLSLKKP